MFSSPVSLAAAAGAEALIAAGLLEHLAAGPAYPIGPRTLASILPPQLLSCPAATRATVPLIGMTATIWLLADRTGDDRGHGYLNLNVTRNVQRYG
jgi:hypothetical protein